MPKTDIARTRTQDLARIHIVAKALQLPRDAYEAVVAAQCPGHSSSASLSAAQRSQLVSHLEHLCQRSGIALPKVVSHQPRRLNGPQGKIRALWIRLGQAGRLTSRTDRALDTWVKRTVKVERLEWVKDVEASTCIEALKQWCAREKVAV